MKEIILIVVEIVNTLHDMILEITSYIGLDVTDKDLHLWILGIIGICIFGLTHAVFTFLSKYSITAISFIYTFTVMVVLVFAIEIQQQITGRGSMEFDDAVIGLWGFILFFSLYLLFKAIRKGIQYLSHSKNSKTNNH